MSEREDLQNRIADFCTNNGLNDVYGVITSLDTLTNGRKVRTVTFCHAATLDGVIEIYSPKFIALKSSQDNDSMVFESEKDLLDYIRLRWVEFNSTEAENVPRRAR